MCVYGVTATAPGLSEGDSQVLQGRGMRCLEGTGDSVENAEHVEMIQKAQAYALEYNVELLRRIREGLVT